MRIFHLFCLLSCLSMLSGCGGDSSTPPVVLYGSVAIETLPADLDHGWTLTGPGDLTLTGDRDTFLAEIEVGAYTVAWARITGWMSPSPVSLEVAENDTTVFTGVYDLDPNALGHLTVDATPDFLGVSWRLTGPADLFVDGQGDTLITDLRPGEYTIRWDGVEDWIAPETGSGILYGFGTLDFTGGYILDADHSHTLHIDTRPDSLSIGWVLKVDMGEGYFDRAGYGDATVENLPTTLQTLDWLDVPDWIPPDPDVATIDPVTGGVTTVVGEYRPRPQLEIRMVTVPAGSFLMGSPSTETGHGVDEAPLHMVTLSRDFLISDTEITQGQWDEVMDWNRSSNKAGPNYPVDLVKWEETLEFCNALSLAEGLTPAYALGDEIVWDLDADGYRLPTEAEWEYACRAGASTALSIGDLEAIGCDFDSKLASMGWYCHNAMSGARPAASLAPNAWGLYDMHGNVLEWCWDAYDEDYYASSPSVDPTGASGGGRRAVRGGAFDTYAERCRNAARMGIFPEMMVRGLGLRIVRNAP